MLRTLFFVLLVFASQLTAQTPATRNLFTEAVQKAESEDFATAANLFQRVIISAQVERASDDFLARAHFNLGACLYRQKQTEKSIIEFAEAIKLSRRSYQRAFYALGMAESDLKNFDRAAVAFRDALRLNQSDGEAWFDLGLIYLQNRDFAQAEKAFSNAVKFKSSSVSEAHNNLGVIFAVRHDFERAEQEFETALAAREKPSTVARDNLRFCRYYRQREQNVNTLIAALKFGRKEEN